MVTSNLLSIIVGLKAGTLNNCSTTISAAVTSFLEQLSPFPHKFSCNKTSNLAASKPVSSEKSNCGHIGFKDFWVHAKSKFIQIPN